MLLAKKLTKQERSVLRMAIADFIVKQSDNKEAVTLTDVRCVEIYNRYSQNLDVATQLFNQLP